jgi:dTDP-4-amino-4,6-dideoxygalactose transaminase
MKPIYVTQPYLPPLEDFIPYLEQIWDSKVLTNGGFFHQQLEKELCKYLGVDYISLFANGTIALVTALQALKIKGEVITTPYSYVATAHSLLWNDISPVFVDIEPSTFNIDPVKVEAAITSRTKAILAVHCYGNPCNSDAIEKIANKYGLKVIYDAAHAFGVKDVSGSILNYGDLSVLSFHATKVFNTFEGGAIISHDKDMKERIDRLKNFGFVDEVTVVESGINGKMSEINAAFGLVQLKHVDMVIALRKKIDHMYRIGLKPIVGINFPEKIKGVQANYSYFPILIEPNYCLTRDELYEKLRGCGIYARRYFYPLISDFPIYQNFVSANPLNLSKAKDIAGKVLCLPIYPDMREDDVARVVEAISK